jgi:hypothetical protein
MINRYSSCESQAAINELRSRLETQAEATLGREVWSILSRDDDGLDEQVRRIVVARRKMSERMVEISNMANERTKELENA